MHGGSVSDWRKSHRRLLLHKQLLLLCRVAKCHALSHLPQIYLQAAWPHALFPTAFPIAPAGPDNMCVYRLLTSFVKHLFDFMLAGAAADSNNLFCHPPQLAR